MMKYKGKTILSLARMDKNAIELNAVELKVKPTFEYKSTSS